MDEMESAVGGKRGRESAVVKVTLDLADGSSMTYEDIEGCVAYIFQKTGVAQVLTASKNKAYEASFLLQREILNHLPGGSNF